MHHNNLSTFIFLFVFFEKSRSSQFTQKKKTKSKILGNCDKQTLAFHSNT